MKYNHIVPTERRFFTWDEANALLPRLCDILQAAAQIRAQLRQAHEKLDELGSPPTRETLDAPGPDDVVRLRKLFKGLYEALVEQLRPIEDMGAELKDIETGLIDFPYRRDGKEVLLCWRYGEPEVGYWHDLQTGVRGRKPLEDSDRKRGRTLH